MRKFLCICLALVMLTACSQESKENQVQDATVEDRQDQVSDEANETATESAQDNSEKEGQEGDRENNTVEESSDAEMAWEKPEEIEEMGHMEVVDLAYSIFSAQDRLDFSFLQAHVTKGTKIDQDKHRFYFGDAANPFEMEFFTEEDLSNLEFRYTHEDDGLIIVGFAAINYEEESSFVIDLEFVEEAGSWKMRSMDINA